MTRRHVLAVAGIATLLLSGSVGTGLAAAPAPVAVANISPAAGQVVGVGMPVTVTFAKPIVDRRAAEDAISLESSRTPAGNFTWLDDTTARRARTPRPR